MSSSIGWAWVHCKKQYEKQFNEPSPKWISEYALYDRLRLVKAACNLKWRLPQDVLPDHKPNSKNVK
jgi:hypothetical protein